MEIRLPASIEALPLHRSRLEAGCRAGMADPGVVGMVIAGSFVEGRPDPYSDLDLRVVTEDDAYERILGRRRELAEASGTVVASFPGDHVGEPRLLITLYRDLLHVDFLVVPISGLAEENHGRPAHVLWERDGRVSAALPGDPERHPSQDLMWMEDRMWTWVWYTHSKICRGELYEVLDALNSLRVWVLFRLVAMTAGELHRGARFAEARLAERAPAFARTVAGLDPVDCLAALRAVVRLYLELADPLLERHGIAPAEDARAVVLAALEEGLDFRPPAS